MQIEVLVASKSKEVGTHKNFWEAERLRWQETRVCIDDVVRDKAERSDRSPCWGFICRKWRSEQWKE